MVQKRCPYCGRWFKPKLRKGPRQVTCGAKACRAAQNERQASQNQPARPRACGAARRPRRDGSLAQKAMLPEGEERIRRDYQMIEHGNTHDLPRADQPPGRVPVIGRRRAVTGWMVMHDHDCRTGPG